MLSVERALDIEVRAALLAHALAAMAARRKGSLAGELLATAASSADAVRCKTWGGTGLIDEQEILRNSELAEDNFWSQASDRSKTKERIVRDLAERAGEKLDIMRTRAGATPGDDDEINRVMGVLLEDVDAVVRNWANTSGDGDARAVAFQLAVQEEFGLDDAFTDHFGDVRPAAGGWLEETHRASSPAGAGITNRDFLRSIARAQYEATQEALKKAGITELWLWRGASYDEELTEGIQKFLLQPASSFSSSFEQARGFGGGLNFRYLHLVRVGAADVLSTARTGVGCLPEREVVLLGGRVSAWGVNSKRRVATSIRSINDLVAQQLNIQLVAPDAKEALAAFVRGDLEEMNLRLRSFEAKESDFVTMRSLDSMLEPPPADVEQLFGGLSESFMRRLVRQHSYRYGKHDPPDVTLQRMSHQVQNVHWESGAYEAFSDRLGDVVDLDALDDKGRFLPGAPLSGWVVELDVPGSRGDFKLIDIGRWLGEEKGDLGHSTYGVRRYLLQNRIEFGLVGINFFDRRLVVRARHEPVAFSLVSKQAAVSVKNAVLDKLALAYGLDIDDLLSLFHVKELEDLYDKDISPFDAISTVADALHLDLAEVADAIDVDLDDLEDLSDGD